ncbi:hypothetical protein B0T10DRAFT_14708 [Thelonectria olida]|uniref:Uncharacterized protein n=1 Tax=Thelonectria olida TaxID=1576542 RepID=A0A9P8WHG8_9HYPO|nr:hypothetical protein B0T10DRAFT_14708 [Thelonectria olida]
MPRGPAKKRVHNSDNNDSEDSAPKKTKRPSRKANTAQTNRSGGSTARGTECSTDATASKKKKKIGASDVKEQIRKQGDDLVSFIETQLRGHSNTKCEMTPIDEELVASLTSVSPWVTSPPVSSQALAYPPQLHERALDELYAVIESYEKLNVQSTGIKKPTWMRWEKDGKELTELNEHAMGFAACNVNFTVMPGLRGSMAEPPANAGDIHRMAWELVEEGRPKKGEETWGTTAQGQVKAFREVLRLLPSER